MVEHRRGPYAVEIRRGSWEERLLELIAGARREHPERDRALLLVEGRESAGPLADLLERALPESLAVQRWTAHNPGLLCLTDEVERLLGANEADDVLLVAIAGSASRKDGIKAAWKLQPLADRLWVFVHDAIPPAGLPPTVGDHVAHFLDVVEGLAFMEGPKGS